MSYYANKDYRAGAQAAMAANARFQENAANAALGNFTRSESFGKLAKFVHEHPAIERIMSRLGTFLSRPHGAPSHSFVEYIRINIKALAKDEGDVAKSATALLASLMQQLDAACQGSERTA